MGTFSLAFYWIKDGLKPDFVGIRLSETIEGKEKRECERKKGSVRELVKGTCMKGTCMVNSSKGSTTTAALHPSTLSLDESFSIHHKGRGIFGTANNSHHRNTLQFHITFEPAPHMDN